MTKSSRPKAIASADERQEPSPEASSRVKPGYPAEHKQFGKGTVVSVEGDKLTIRFKSLGVKVVLESYVRLG